MRNLVSIKTIDDIVPIKDANAIETAILGGWKSVVKKNQFKAGDSVAYFEIDAFLPESVPVFASFAERGRKEVINPDSNEKVSGHVLKTAFLRKVMSQGLILPLKPLKLKADDSQEVVDARMQELGVFKYEAPLPVGTSGDVVGAFPAEIIQKTDSERVQNLDPEFFASLNRDDWFATEKIDGMSSTFIKQDGALRIASRNWELAIEDGGVFMALAAKMKLADIMPDGVSIQGEIYGPGIQKNRLNVTEVRLAVFNVQVQPGVELTPEFNAFIAEHKVPVLKWTLPETIDEVVEQVLGMRSYLNPKVLTEGVVWWNKNGEAFMELGNRANFKAINNKYLLK